jgi:hypothetical protein
MQPVNNNFNVVDVLNQILECNKQINIKLDNMLLEMKKINDRFSQIEKMIIENKQENIN